MYARCPACQTAYRVGIDQLRASHGEILCKRCHTAFNALTPGVAQGPRPEPADGKPTPPPPPHWDRERLDELDKADFLQDGNDMPTTDYARRKRHTSIKAAELLRWGGAALGLSILLGIQVFGFEGGRLAQNIYARPALERLCAGLGCGLPPFKDTAHINILDRSLSAPRDNKEILDFRMVFANQSALPQDFPDIRLVLDALDGHPIAERVFAPMDYLPDWQEGAEMPVDKSYEVRLSLAKPSRDVGGFTIDFR